MIRKAYTPSGMDINDVIELITKGECTTVEFKQVIHRDSAKVVVSMLNTEGGHILYGVTDKGEIVGVHDKNPQTVFSQSVLQGIYPTPKIDVFIVKINDKSVLVSAIYADKKHIYSISNIAYIRMGAVSKPLSIDEILYKAVESTTVKFDEGINYKVKSTELSMQIIKRYVKRKQDIRGITTPPKINDSLLASLEIIKKKNGNYYVTNAGILFFMSNPQHVLRCAKIRVTQSKDELATQVDRYFEIEGSIWDQLVNTVDKIRDVVGTESLIAVDIQRKERARFPLLAIREAIANAIIHRNYFVESEINVFILPERIEIVNPGSFPPGSSPDSPIHIARNPVLCRYMYDVGLIEKYGQGINRMHEYCKASGFPPPQFIVTSSFTKVVFHHVPLGIMEKREELDAVDMKILEGLKTQQASSHLSVYLNLSKQSIVTRLKRLIGHGLVKHIGRGKNTCYIAIR